MKTAEDDRAPAPPSVGDRLADRYVLTALLGRGGFGAVFEARDEKLDRVVALKVLRDPAGGDAERLLREARAVAAVESDHVVRLFEVGTLPDGAPFLVMERLRGVTLEEYTLSLGGTLPVQEAIDLVIQACAGLHAAHAAGIVHRDLKPRNLFVTRRIDGAPALKVLDFGIAKVAGTSGLTAANATMGTLRYAAPEQIRDARSADARADVWALGVVLYELLSGGPLFDASSDAAFGALVLVADPAPLAERAPAVGPEICAAVHRCLRRSREERFATVGELASALAPFASEGARREAAALGGAAPGPPGPTTGFEGSGTTTDGGSGATIDVGEPPESPASEVKGTPEATGARAVEASRSGERWWRPAAVIAALVALGGGVWRLSARPAEIAPPGVLPSVAEVPSTSSPGEAASAEGAPSASGQSDPPAAPQPEPSARPTSGSAASPASPAPSAAPAPPSSGPAAGESTGAARAGRVAAADPNLRTRRFVDACLSAGVIPTFLTSPGAPRFVCNSLAYSGCDSVRARCQSRTAPHERSTCAAFLAHLRAAKGCD